jgi:hypothetical protein
LASLPQRPGIRRIASFVTPRQRCMRLLTLTAATVERSTASPAEQVFACRAIVPRYSPAGGVVSGRPAGPVDPVARLYRLS